MRYLHISFVFALALTFASCTHGCKKPAMQDDPTTAVCTTEDVTVTSPLVYTSLEDYLSETLEKGTMFGMQMPTIHGISDASGKTWYNSDMYDESDIKNLVGSNPAVCGWEIGQIELCNGYNLDGDRIDVIRNHIIASYRRGAVNTISWHANNPVTGGRYSDTCEGAVKSILPGGDKHEMFMGWMNTVADFILSLKTEDGDIVPVIFRPWHEHSDTGKGSGFWWSIGNNSIEEYISLWKMTYNFFVGQKGIKNMLWAFSPDLHHLCWDESWNNKTAYMNAWPGDEYVDILGLDAYETPWSNFASKADEVVEYVYRLSIQKKKFFAITETGFANNSPEHQKHGFNAQWWTKRLYPLTHGRKVSYVLIWRNDSFPTDGKFPEYFGPFPGCYSANDFIEYASKKDILFEKDLK